MDEGLKKHKPSVMLSPAVKRPPPSVVAAPAKKARKDPRILYELGCGRSSQLNFFRLQQLSCSEDELAEVIETFAKHHRVK